MRFYSYKNQQQLTQWTSTMADFGDGEDIQLFQLAKMFVDGSRPICWEYVMKSMRKTKKTKKQLCNRLKQLKRRYSCDLSAFPARFFVLPPPKRKKKSVKVLPTSIPLLGDTEAWQKIYMLFDSVPKLLVHQKSGQTDRNVGELVPKGVSDLLAAIGNIKETDVFLDVGAGVGNVVCQVAMQTPASKCFGIELRGELVQAAAELLRSATRTCLLLKKVELVAGDIREVTHAVVRPATIVYSFNQVFNDESNVSLERLVCKIRGLHTLVVAIHPCPRHSARCFKEFCMKWSLEKELAVAVSWTCTVARLYLFRRK